MVRKITALLTGFALLLLCAGSLADIAWPENTEGQRILKAYAETANRYLKEQGEPGINSLFESYTGFEVFGITEFPDAEVPERVEITAYLYAEAINRVQIRVSDLGRFPRISASFIQALNPDKITREEALSIPTKRMQRAAGSPGNSFEEETETLNGAAPYIYCGYYPNQYHDGVDWMQMTIVFPLDGYWNGEDLNSGSEATRAPDTYSDHSADYEGYDSEDDYSHYEIFSTATPEPDSAAAEFDLW